MLRKASFWRQKDQGESQNCSKSSLYSFEEWSIDCMPRKFYTDLSSHCQKQSDFPWLGHANHIDIDALFTLCGLKPDIYILGQANFGVRTMSEHVLSHFTPVVCSSEKRQFFLYTRVLQAHFCIFASLWHHLLGLSYVIQKDLLWSKAWNGKWAQNWQI